MDTTITAEAKYYINFTASKKKQKLPLSLDYNRCNIFLYVNGIKICHFKPKNSEIKPYHLLLGNISKGFTVDNMNNWYAYDILGIHKYLTEKTHVIKECSNLLNKLLLHYQDLVDH